MLYSNNNDKKNKSLFEKYSLFCNINISDKVIKRQTLNIDSYKAIHKKICLSM